MEDEIFEALVKEYAEALGEYYLKENERLQRDPAAAVPPEVEKRMLELIEKAFKDK